MLSVTIGYVTSNGVLYSNIPLILFKLSSNLSRCIRNSNAFSFTSCTISGGALERNCSLESFFTPKATNPAASEW